MLVTVRYLRFFWAIFATALAVASARAAPPIEGRLVDLTHTFSGQTIYWPTARPFALETVARGTTSKGFHYAANDFCAAEHGGTHFDAPAHFAETGETADRVPLERLVGPAVVINTSPAATTNRDYRVLVKDLTAWEGRHGEIPAGAIVLLHTGFGRFWPDPIRYLGTAERGEGALKSLHFPGLHPEAARWLVTQRSVDAVGIDTASIDYGQSERFEAHRILAERGIPIFENVANLDRVPPAGATIIALPMKIGEGSGGPLRIIAVLEEAGPERTAHSE